MASSLPRRPPSPSDGDVFRPGQPYLPPAKRARGNPGPTPPLDILSSSESGSSADGDHVLAIPSRTAQAPKRAVPFQQPSCFTSYSVTAPVGPSAHRTAHLGSNRCLARYAPCPPGADLAYGFERCVWPDEARKNDEGLDDLIASVRRFERENLGGQKVLGQGKKGFVSFRGTMTKLLTAPYDGESLELSAQMVDGNIYLEQHKEPPREMDDHAKRRTYNGFSFESYSTQPIDPLPAETLSTDPPGWSGDVDLNDEWCAVVKTALDGVRLVLGGEVDCLDGPFDGSLSNAIELKTAVQPLHAGQVRRFEQKLLRFWAQSFLLGVPAVVVGFRRANPPIIDTVQRFETMAIPRMVRPTPAPPASALQPPPPWEAQVCLAFAAEVLHFLRRVILPAGEADAEGRARIWSVQLGGSGRQLKCRELAPGSDEWAGRVREESRARGPRWGILPAWVRDGREAPSAAGPPKLS